MIEVKNLTKIYGQHHAVDDISFTVEDGEVLGFLGPNGAGKTTTMNILTGYLSATSGQAMIDGVDILDDPEGVKKKIGYLPEFPPIYMDMTVGEYLDTVTKLKKVKEIKRKEMIQSVMEVTRIADMKDRLIANLSKGYKQRVGLAQALVGDPKILILDEPTVGLDPKQIIEIRNLIRTLGKEHTVILSTHILQEVQAVCDRIVIINKGKIVADELTENISRAVENTRRFNVKISGPQRDVLALLRNLPGICYAEVLAARDGDAYTYMIESEVGIDIRKKLFWALAERKWPLIGMEALGMSIEDIFIAVVDKTAPEGAQKTKKKTRYEGVRAAEEKEVAAGIVTKTVKEQENASFDEETSDSEYYEDHSIKEDTFASEEKTEEKK